MKKIISFSLWGNNPKYTIGAIRNAELTNTIFNGWISRFYCGLSVPMNIIDKLRCIDNCEVIIMDVSGNLDGAFWRFNAISDNDVDVIISRDCDSRLGSREKDAVDEWLNSDKLFHIMRDHPCHGIEILAGMWGVKSPLLKNMNDLVVNYNKNNFYQDDQIFLKNIIYPLVKDQSIIHDEFFNYNINKKQFPNKRDGLAFVGEIFDENENPIMEHRKMLLK